MQSIERLFSFVEENVFEPVRSFVANNFAHLFTSEEAHIEDNVMTHSALGPMRTASPDGTIRGPDNQMFHSGTFVREYVRERDFGIPLDGW